MERMGRWALLAVGMFLTVQTARSHYLYGAWLDDGTVTVEFAGLAVPFGMGIVMVVLHVGKTTLPAMAASFWRHGHFMYFLLAVLLFLVLLPVSITSTFGFLDLQRGARAAGENSTHKREADLRSELAGVQAWLKDGGWRRPAALVEAEIAAERRSPFWASTNECRQATARPEQRFCQALDRYAGEFAGAREAEQYRGREKGIYEELKRIQPATGTPNPDLEFLSRALAISVEKAGFWRTILFAAAIETAEALLLLLGSVPTGIDHRKRVRPRRTNLRSLLNQWRVRSSVPRQPPPPAVNGWSSATVAKGASDTKVTNAPATRSAPARGNQRAHSSCAGPDGVELSSCACGAASMPEQAVAAFVGTLPRVPGARASGRAMFQAYEARRAVQGWPRMPPSHVETEVEWPSVRGLCLAVSVVTERCVLAARLTVPPSQAPPPTS
jgi:hypothetical protein